MRLTALAMPNKQASIGCICSPTRYTMFFYGWFYSQYLLALQCFGPHRSIFRSVFEYLFPSSRWTSLVPSVHKLIAFTWMLCVCVTRLSVSRGFPLACGLHLSVEEQPVGNFPPREMLRHMFLTHCLNCKLLTIFHRGFDFLVDHGYPIYFAKGPRPSLWNGLRTARVKIRVKCYT
jgi:hypothetical protein